MSREFLENMKKRQEKKVNDLLEDNKELIESIKRKDEVERIRISW